MALLRRPHPYASALDPPPPAITSPSAKVCLQHPQDLLQTLKAFAALDNGGLFQQVLLDAAYVLSGCRVGYLVRHDPFQLDSPPTRIPFGQEILTCGIYTYVVTDGENDTITETWIPVPTFEEWTFPIHEFPIPAGDGFVYSPAHSDRLRHWHIREMEPNAPSLRGSGNTSTMSAEVRNRDSQRCVLSGWRSASSLENARLIPGKHEEWCRKNLFSLTQTIDPRGAIDDLSNGLTLRGDLHTSLDRCYWLVFPKEHRFVAHFLISAEDAVQFYHNVPLRIHMDTSITAIFARFAHNVFAHAETKLDARQRKRSAGDARSSSRTVSSTADAKKSGGLSPSLESASKQRKGQPETGHRRHDGEEAGYDAGTLRSLCEPYASDQSGQQDTTLHSAIKIADTEKTRQEYLRSNPSVSALRDPTRIADERTWRTMLDDDDYV